MAEVLSDLDDEPVDESDELPDDELPVDVSEDDDSLADVDFRESVR